MKSNPSVKIYRELTKRGVHVVISRMKAERVVYIEIAIGFNFNKNKHYYKNYEHSWEPHETFDVQEIYELIKEDIRQFELEQVMDEALE